MVCKLPSHTGRLSCRVCEQMRSVVAKQVRQGVPWLRAMATCLTSAVVIVILAFLERRYPGSLAQSMRLPMVRE